MNLPPTPQPPAVLARIAALAAGHRPTFAETCEDIAAQFRRLAQAAYEVGDQGRGDHYTARGLAWEFARDTNDLTVLRERP